MELSLRHPKHYPLAAKLLKHFIFSPNPQLSIYQKFIEKAIPLSNSISTQILSPFLNMLQTMIFLYRETTTVLELSTIVSSLAGDSVNILTEEEMKQEIDLYSWKVTVKNWKMMPAAMKQQPGLRGLTNIGNCKGLNMLSLLFE